MDLRYEVRLVGGKYDDEPVASFASLSQAKLFAASLAAEGESLEVIDLHKDADSLAYDHRLVRLLADNPEWQASLRIDAAMDDAEAVLDQYAGQVAALRDEATALRRSREFLVGFDAPLAAVEREMLAWSGRVADCVSGFRPRLVQMRREAALAAD